MTAFMIAFAGLALVTAMIIRIRDLDEEDTSSAPGGAPSPQGEGNKKGERDVRR